jgi:hypothetical protein
VALSAVRKSPVVSTRLPRTSPDGHRPVTAWNAHTSTSSSGSTSDTKRKLRLGRELARARLQPCRGGGHYPNVRRSGYEPGPLPLFGGLRISTHDRVVSSLTTAAGLRSFGPSHGAPARRPAVGPVDDGPSPSSRFEWTTAVRTVAVRARRDPQPARRAAAAARRLGPRSPGARRGAISMRLGPAAPRVVGITVPAISWGAAMWRAMALRPSSLSGSRVCGRVATYPLRTTTYAASAAGGAGHPHRAGRAVSCSPTDAQSACQRRAFPIRLWWWPVWYGVTPCRAPTRLHSLRTHRRDQEMIP